MSRQVKVIFTETKKGQFVIGQERLVKAGYARNYLLPQKLAELVNKQNTQRLSFIRKKADKKLAALRKQANELKATLDGQTLRFKVKTHDAGKLYGSIVANDISESLNTSFKVSTDKHDIALSAPIKVVGEYTVNVSVHAEVPISLTVVVESENPEQDAGLVEAKKREEEAARASEATAEDLEQASAEQASSEADTQEAVAAEANGDESGASTASTDATLSDEN